MLFFLCFIKLYYIVFLYMYKYFHDLLTQLNLFELKVINQLGDPHT